MKPYMEYTVGLNKLGIGKAKFLRVDYIRNQQGANSSDGVVFGLTLLNVLD